MTFVTSLIPSDHEDMVTMYWNPVAGAGRTIRDAEGTLRTQGEARVTSFESTGTDGHGTKIYLFV